MTKVRTRSNSASAGVPVAKQVKIQFQVDGTNLGTKGTVDLINFLILTGGVVTRVGNTITVTIGGGGGSGGGWAVTGQTDLTGNVQVLPTTDNGQAIELGSTAKRLLLFQSVARSISLNADTLAAMRIHDPTTFAILHGIVMVAAGMQINLGSDAEGDLYYRGATYLTRLAKGTALQGLRMNAGATAPEWAAAGSGDVVGPASSTDSRIAEFSGTTGKLLKDGGVVVSAFIKTVLDDADAAAARATLGAEQAGIITVIPIYHSAANLTLTNQATTEQELANITPGYRTKFDGTRQLSIRIVVDVAVLSNSANSPRLYIQYSTDESAWTTVGAGTVASGEAISLAATGVKVTSWIAMPAGATADVFYRIAQHGGDAAADPAVRDISIHVRTT